MIKELLAWFAENHEKQLSGRYIHLDDITALLSKHNAEQIGFSVLKKPIHKITIGKGPKRILLWSQMHGNESTTTKAIFDFLKWMDQGNGGNIRKDLLTKCTLLIVPMLNPDGSAAYTRVNANDVDLNRDAQLLSQPESVVLREVFDDFKPDFCFNLHGQRTIFSAGPVNNSASLSFLSPAFDKERSLNDVRKKGMEIIADLNAVLQTLLPGQIGRYDDSYNNNCVGDTFQTLGATTILFEAGHINNDYQREEVRGYIFYSLVHCLNYISSNDQIGDGHKAYFDIPENKKLFYDIILRNVLVENENESSLLDIAIQYKETLMDGELRFIPLVEKIGGLETFFGHLEIDAKGARFNYNGLKYPALQQKAQEISLNQQFFSTFLTQF